jgi:hypothetical protein
MIFLRMLSSLPGEGQGSKNQHQIKACYAFHNFHDRAKASSTEPPEKNPGRLRSSQSGIEQGLAT